MGTLTQLQLENLATAIKKGAHIPSFNNTIVYSTMLETKLYSKGRPRFTKAGHAFTPANTRKYEKKLRAHFALGGTKIVMHPVAIIIDLHYGMPKAMTEKERRLADISFLLPHSGDVDNRAKSVLDAANGVVYSDDSQISSLSVNKRYTRGQERFYVRVYRSGLSPAEVHNIGNFL
jgi:Holliday junction resolvase RusA-like endonuclease